MDSSIVGKEPIFGVVLLHGLYAKADELIPIAEGLKNQFGNSLLVIQPTCRARFKSVVHSIAKQSKNVFRSIKEELLAYNRDLSAFPLILIGYSQGGVVACSLGNVFRTHLNIVAIVTLNAPLIGAPLLARSRAELKAFISDAEEGLELIGYPLSRIKRSMSLHTWMSILVRPKWIGINGVKDIAPNSRCTQEVHNFLETNETIPCLLIGTHANNFLEFFNSQVQTSKESEAIKRLNDVYALFITGSKGGKHDTLIPLESQLGRKSHGCKEISINSTTPCSNQSPVKRIVYSGILHARNLVAMDPALFIDYGETVLSSDAIFMHLVQFIRKLV